MKNIEERLRAFFYFLIRAFDRDEELSDAQKQEARKLFLDLEKAKREEKLN